MTTLELQVDNMHCGACVRRVLQTLNTIPSTRAEAVDVGHARVATDAAPEQVTAALAAAGYPARVAGQ